MKVKLIYDSWLVPKGFGAITIYPFVFFATSIEDTPPSLIRHELVHTMQVERVGWWKFYSSYLFYFVKNLLIYKNVKEAYWFIPYEIEARGIEHE